MKKLLPLCLLLAAPGFASAGFVVIDDTPRIAPSLRMSRAEVDSEPMAAYQPPVYQAGSYQAPARVPVAAPVLASNASAASRDRLVAFINQFVMSGQMEPAVAIKLMRALIDAELASAPAAAQPGMQYASLNESRQAPSYAPAPIAAAMPVFAPAPVPAARWTLDTKLTLKDNIDAWSKTAGWHTSQWDASNEFQITAAATVEGDFPGVLRQIADSTGLNICAKTAVKTVHVTDASVSCK